MAGVPSSLEEFSREGGIRHAKVRVSEINAAFHKSVRPCQAAPLCWKEVERVDRIYTNQGHCYLLKEGW
jgi:hypothetical protein